MKRVLVTAMVGMSAVAHALAQGSIRFDNYAQGTGNQVYWDDLRGGALAGQAVLDPSLVLQLCYGEGVITDPAQLTRGVTTTIDTSNTFVGPRGPGGYFSGPVQVLDTWDPGDVFTFQVIVIGPSGVSGSTILWQESATIHDVGSQQAAFNNFPGLAVSVPEPSALALIGLGVAAILLRRRA